MSMDDMQNGGGFPGGGMPGGFTFSTSGGMPGGMGGAGFDPNEIFKMFFAQSGGMDDMGGFGQFMGGGGRRGGAGGMPPGFGGFSAASGGGRGGAGPSFRFG